MSTICLSYSAVAALLLLGACGRGAEEPTDVEVQSNEVVAPAAEATDRPSSFGVCASCHPVDSGRNALGPSLFGVDGRKAGTLANYTYSVAMKESGTIWTRETLDAFLRGPQRLVPGTKMAYPGMRDDAKRSEVVDYLLTLK